MKRCGGFTEGLTIMNGQTNTGLHHAITRECVVRCEDVHMASMSQTTEISKVSTVTKLLVQVFPCKSGQPVVKMCQQRRLFPQSALCLVDKREWHTALTPVQLGARWQIRGPPLAKHSLSVARDIDVV
jgi:hypothetical protein